MATISQFLNNRVTVGPYDFIEWISKNRGDYPRGDKLEKLMLKLHSNLMQDGRIMNEKNLPKSFYLELPGANLFGGAADDRKRLLSSIEASDRLFRDKVRAVEIHAGSSKGIIKRTIKRMCMVALNMDALKRDGSSVKWAYPTYDYYYTITPYEAEYGVTNDFVKKHFSSTEDFKSSKNVAHHRSQPENIRTVKYYGKIVTSKSGAIKKQAQNNFTKEILGRCAAFTKAHEEEEERWIDGKGLTLSGGLAFWTDQKYGYFMYNHGKREEQTVYIKFSVSCDLAGTKWAVHHLATSSETKD